MTFRRFITGIFALALAGSLSAGAAQALSVDLISNGGVETGNLSGWSTTSNGSGESFESQSGSFLNPALSGNYDVSYDPNYRGVSTLTQFFTVPDQVISATFNFTQQIGLYGYFDIPDQQFTASIVDSLGTVISQVYSTASSGLQIGSGTASTLSFDLTSLMQANAGNSLGVQFSLEAQRWSMTATLDDIAMMVETPAAVPLPPTIWMMLAALGLFGFLGWKRREGGNSASFTANLA
ncbi:PEP-CTERM sorting domain-containing protein [Thioclava sp.]|uniref:PEP-CTERM sorting domain-containing protein n=1 Tax=Thioclava sp. TaxID=1933450 RepID=UPI003AA913AC